MPQDLQKINKLIEMGSTGVKYTRPEVLYNIPENMQFTDITTGRVYVHLRIAARYLGYSGPQPLQNLIDRNQGPERIQFMGSSWIEINTLKSFIPPWLTSKTGAKPRGIK